MLDFLDDVGDFLSDVGGAIADGLNALGRFGVGRAGGQAYKQAAHAMRYVMNVGKPRKVLSDDWKAALRPTFGDLVDLVRVVYDAQLLDHFPIIVGGPLGNVKIPINEPDAQTFGSTIYVESAHRPKDNDQLYLIGHEMVHVRQWADLGGSDVDFGREYFEAWYDAGMSYRKNVMEREAYHFQDCLEITHSQRFSYPITSFGEGAVAVGQWTRAFSLVLGTEPCVGFYNRQTGAVTVLAVGQSSFGLPLRWKGQWPKGISVIATFPLGTNTHALLYDGTTGTAHFGRFPQALGSAPWVSLGAEAWSKGWTSIAAFPLQGRPHYLKYKQDSGAVHIEAVKADGTRREDVWSDNWSEGWTHIEPFATAAGMHLLCYKRYRGGSVHIPTVEPSGQGIREGPRARWSEGWTHVSPLIYKSSPYALVYKGPDSGAPYYRSGEYRLVRLGVSPDDALESCSCGMWSASWDHVHTVSGAGGALFLRTRVSDGKIKIDRLGGN